MADIKAGGAFVEISAKDSTAPGLASVQVSVARAAEAVKASSAKVGESLKIAITNIAAGDLRGFTVAGQRAGRDFMNALKETTKAAGNILKESTRGAVSGTKDFFFGQGQTDSAIRLGKAIAGARIAAGGLQVATKAMKGDWEGVKEAVEGLPFGIGAIASSLIQVGDELGSHLGLWKSTADLQKEVAEGQKRLADADKRIAASKALTELTRELRFEASLLGKEDIEQDIARINAQFDKERDELQKRIDADAAARNEKPNASRDAEVAQAFKDLEDKRAATIRGRTEEGKASEKEIAESIRETQRAIEDLIGASNDINSSGPVSEIDKINQKYDELLVKLKEVADAKREGLTEEQQLSEQLQAIRARDFINWQRELTIRAKIKEQEKATADLVKEAGKSLQALTPAGPVDGAVRDASEKYQSILDRLNDGLIVATTELTVAQDAAAQKSARDRVALIRQEIAQVSDAQTTAARKAAAIARLNIAEAAREQAEAVAKIQKEISTAQAEVNVARGIGSVEKTIGGFDASALALQAISAFRDPTVTELKKANDKLAASLAELKKVNQKGGLTFEG